MTEPIPSVSGIGRDAGHPRAVVLYLRTEPSDDDMRAIQEALRNPQPAQDVAGLVEALEKTLGAAHSAITYRGESTSYEYALRQITAAFAALAAYRAQGGCDD